MITDAAAFYREAIMVFRARCFMWILALSVLGLWGGSTHALAPENENIGCQGEDPLLATLWDGTLPDSGLIGVWRLPLSPRHPDILTEARLMLEWEATNGIRATFSFPDPLPYGIPFSFQKIEILWEDGTVSGRRIVDWSEDCTGPGRSLFPGQSWGSALDPGISRPFKKIRLRLWGSRS